LAMSILLPPEEKDVIVHRIEVPEVRHIRRDTSGTAQVGHWVGLVISAMILVIVVGALFSPLQTALADYAANETRFGPILVTITPILIGVGILLYSVSTFLPKGGKR